MAGKGHRIESQRAAWIGFLVLTLAGTLFADEPRVIRRKSPPLEPVEVDDNHGARPSRVRPRTPTEKPGSNSESKPRARLDETREFRVSVDGKERGRCTMRIDRRDDGTDRMRVNAQLSFNYVVYEYKYSSSGTEIWKEGRLVELDNTSDYNGTRYAVKATADEKGLNVTVNGKAAHHAEPEAWVTSYWHLPAHLSHPGESPREGVVPAGGPTPLAKSKAHVFPLLDSERGRALRGELHDLGEETVNVAGQKMPARHCRVTGDVKADLWYDAASRLVRQESIDQGHQTTLELIRITENPKSQRR